MKKKGKRYRKSYKKKPRRALHKSELFWDISFLVFFVSLLSYFLFLSSIFEIKEIQISGTQQEIESFVEKEISKPILFKDSRNIFLSRPQTIAQKLINEFPNLARIKVARSYPNKIIIEAQERSPAGILCAQECFLIDYSGTIFKQVEEESNLIIRIDGSYNLGDKVLSVQEIKLIVDIFSAIDGIKEFHFERPIAETLMKGGWKIIFDLNQDVSLQLFNLSLVLEEKIAPEKRSHLDYIDLRFNNRAYFKYRD